jgi:hypothetical protein
MSTESSKDLTSNSSANSSSQDDFDIASPDKWGEFKQFYGKAYAIIGIVNPLILFFSIPGKMPFLWIISFFLMFGLIWPITYVTYPVFIMSYEKQYQISALDCLLSLPTCISSHGSFVWRVFLVYLAFIFPLLTYGYYIWKHWKFIQKEVGRPVGLISVVDRFVR